MKDLKITEKDLTKKLMKFLQFVRISSVFQTRFFTILISLLAELSLAILGIQSVCNSGKLSISKHEIARHSWPKWA